MNRSLREQKGETAKETRRAVEDRSLVKNKDDEKEREDEAATSVVAKDTTMVAILGPLFYL